MIYWFLTRKKSQRGHPLLSHRRLSRTRMARQSPHEIQFDVCFSMICLAQHSCVCSSNDNKVVCQAFPLAHYGFSFPGKNNRNVDLSCTPGYRLILAPNETIPWIWVVIWSSMKSCSISFVESEEMNSDGMLCSEILFAWKQNSSKIFAVCMTARVEFRTHFPCKTANCQLHEFICFCRE